MVFVLLAALSGAWAADSASLDLPTVLAVVSNGPASAATLFGPPAQSRTLETIPGTSAIWRDVSTAGNRWTIAILQRDGSFLAATLIATDGKSSEALVGVCEKLGLAHYTVQPLRLPSTRVSSSALARDSRIAIYCAGTLGMHQVLAGLDTTEKHGPMVFLNVREVFLAGGKDPADVDQLLEDDWTRADGWPATVIGQALRYRLHAIKAASTVRGAVGDLRAPEGVRFVTVEYDVTSLQQASVGASPTLVAIRASGGVSYTPDTNASVQVALAAGRDWFASDLHPGVPVRQIAVFKIPSHLLRTAMLQVADYPTGLTFSDAVPLLVE